MAAPANDSSSQLQSRRVVELEESALKVKYQTSPFDLMADAISYGHAPECWDNSNFARCAQEEAQRRRTLAQQQYDDAVLGVVEATVIAERHQELLRRLRVINDELDLQKARYVEEYEDVIDYLEWMNHMEPYLLTPEQKLAQHLEEDTAAYEYREDHPEYNDENGN